jgi:hypothetical protein
MSRAAPLRRPAWLRAALILLALLGAFLAPATAAEAAPPPPAVVSGEPAGEAHQDTADSALRVSIRRPVPDPLARITPVRRVPRASTPQPDRRHPHAPTPRSVVLRC